MQPSTTLAGAKIRRWREERKMSAEAFGEQLDPRGVVPAQTVYNWEARGKIARPKLQKLLMDKGVCDAADWLVSDVCLVDETGPELLPTGTG